MNIKVGVCKRTNSQPKMMLQHKLVYATQRSHSNVREEGSWHSTIMTIVIFGVCRGGKSALHIGPPHRHRWNARREIDRFDCASWPTSTVWTYSGAHHPEFSCKKRHSNGNSTWTPTWGAAVDYCNGSVSIWAVHEHSGTTQPYSYIVCSLTNPSICSYYLFPV